MSIFNIKKTATVLPEARENAKKRLTVAAEVKVFYDGVGMNF
jgi:hypothetical protein